jgi:hypothetical protein
MKKNGLVWICCLMCLFAQADSIPAPYFAFGIHGGFVIPHRAEMSHLITGHAAGFSVARMHHFSGKKTWHHAFNFPRHGFELYMSSTGNNDALGHHFATSYLLELPLQTKNKNTSNNRFFKHSLTLGLGVGYSTKRWDLETNHQAPVLGSHTNASISLLYLIQLSPRWQGGLRMTHFSNAAFQLPNLGTNTISLSLRYNTRALRPKTCSEQWELPEKKWIFSATLAGGLKEVLPPTERKYAAGSLTFFADKRMRFKSSFGAGVDLLYNSSLEQLLQKVPAFNGSRTQVAQIGALLGYTLHFDPFDIRIQQGFYVRSLWKDYGFMYQRIGIRYHFTGNWLASLHLKTHFAKADYAELGVGYQF